MHRAIQFSIFPSLPESSTPSPLAGGEGWDGGEKHGLGTLPACTPTLALPLAQGEGKDRQARVRKLNGPERHGQRSCADSVAMVESEPMLPACPLQEVHMTLLTTTLYTP